jgi:ABC-type nitrate/sulfonate/bicarbonate transport system substrate-binding protein
MSGTASQRRQWVTWSIAGALALAAAVGGLRFLRGGAAPTPAGSAVPAASAAAAAERLPVVVLAEGESDLVNVAAAMGYFVAEGLTVQRIQPKRRGVGLKMLRAGKADVAIAGDVAIAAAAVRGAGLAILATVAQADDRVLVLGRKDQGVRALADLKGKRVGVEERLPARYALSRFLAGHGLAPGDVTLVAMKANQLSGALSRGEVAAIADPFAGKHPAVERVGKEPGLDVVALVEPSGYHLALNAVALRETVQKRPAAIRSFVRALLRASDFIGSDRAEAQRVVAEMLAVERSKVEHDWQRLTFGVRLEPALLTALDEEARWFVGSGLADAGAAAPPATSLVYADALRAERPAAVTLPP